jgi:hypothetical protein
MEFLSQDFTHFFNKICSETTDRNIMYLSIFVDSNDEALVNIYKKAAINHNNKIINDTHFYDAGFDLYLPKIESTPEGRKFFGNDLNNKGVHVNKVDFEVKCCAKMYNGKGSFYTPFYTYARSSISKTALRLANNQGIIDAGYRGNLIGMFDCIYTDQDQSHSQRCEFYMDTYSRILQICAPGLVPIYIEIVNTIEELGPSTSRGEGGIGSTGK